MRLSRLLLVHLGLLVAAPFLLFAPPAEAISVTDWYLEVGAQDFTTGEHTGHAFRTVQNPFVDQYSAALSGGLTTASAQYDFSWLLDIGSFVTSAQATAQSADDVGSGTYNSIRISTEEPVNLHIDGSWTYDLPADFMMTRFGVHISGDISHTVLFHQYYDVQTTPWEPTSGTLAIQGDVILPPGETWNIQYDMSLEADAGASFAATGNGYVHLTITPECSSLVLLLPCVVVYAGRSRRASQCCFA